MYSYASLHMDEQKLDDQRKVFGGLSSRHVSLWSAAFELGADLAGCYLSIGDFLRPRLLTPSGEVIIAWRLWRP